MQAPGSAPEATSFQVQAAGGSISAGLSAELASQVQLLIAELAREKAGKLAGLK